MNIENHLPVIKKHPEFEELWESVYKARKIKSGNKKAVYSANAAVTAEILKVFLKENKE